MTIARVSEACGLASCRYRGSLVGSRYMCLSNWIVGDSVTAETCRRCPYADKRPRDNRAVRPPSERLDYISRRLASGRLSVDPNTALSGQHHLARTTDHSYHNQPVPPERWKAGPGTELHAILESMGIKPSESCPCRNRICQMNKWGPEGCRERRDEIVAWLREQQERRGWAEQISAGMRTLTTGLAFRLNLVDPLGSLVDEAIRRATATVDSEDTR